MNWTIILIMVLIIILLYFIITFNKFIKLNNIVKESFATMDVYLKKRWDLIPNLVEVVKGYAKHEEDTFKEISKLRTGNYDNLSYEEKIKTNEELNNSLNKLLMLVENYPELKADKSFLTLNDNLVKTEDEIAQSRKYYNAVVKNYNNKVEMIPSNIDAKILGYRSKLMFSVTDEERKNVKVNL